MLRTRKKPFIVIALMTATACTGGPARVPSPGHHASAASPSNPASNSISLGDERNEPSRPLTQMYPGTGQFIGEKSPHEQPIPEGHPGEGGIQLSFVDADIGQVVASVLGEGLNLNYAIDPSVKGTMALRSSRPLAPEEVLPALEAALRIQDLALVNTNGTYRVVPLKDAPKHVSSLSSVADRRQPGFSIQVVPLQYTSAVEMEKILHPFAGSGSVLRVDEMRNLLLLAGTGQEIDAMMDVVKMFDVDWLAGMSYGFFNLNYVDAKTAVSELSDIFADAKSPLTGMVRLIPLGRLNTILVVTPQQKYLSMVETWIKRLDVGGTTSGRRIFVYDVQNGRAEELARSLNKILSLPSSPDDRMADSRSGWSTSTSGGYSSGGSVNLARASTGYSGGLNSSMGGNPPSLAPLSAGAASAPGTAQQGDLRIVANNDSNSLLILASPSEFSVIEAALLRLDTPNRQVLIEASLAEVTLTDQLKYGVQWNYNGKNGPITLSGAASGAVTRSFPGLSYLFTGSTDISAVLNALESVTSVRVISSPKLVTLNNHEAQLQVGDEVPTATQSAVSVVNPDAPIVNSVQMQNTGVILGVTPRVNKNGLVQLDITQEVSNSIPTTTSSIDSPTIQQRRLSTTVAVMNGDTIALGGLITENRSRSKSGVPYLQKVPIVGALFRDTDNSTTRTELILLITPRVMRDDKEFEAVMDDLKGEFKSLKNVFQDEKHPK